MTVILLLSATQSLMAQEAFYIYRNDGDFNGFFYDQVKRMNLSKVDFDGVEHDDYVIQEVLTDDSLYRIPLLAIDSISFVQPDIIFASNFYDLSREDCPYKNAADGNMACRVDGMTEDGNYILKWRMRWWNDNNDYLSLYENKEQYLAYIPKVGDILYHPNLSLEKGPFVGKVIKADVDPGEWMDIICAPLTDFSEVFEQFISVEELTTKNGKAHSRVAGLDKMKQTRASGNKELTLLDLSGSFPLKLAGNDDFEATLSLDLALSIKANVAYNICRGKNFYIEMKLSEEGSVSATFTAKGTLEDVTTWHLAGTTVYFPTFLPILQLNPAPGAFLKTTGDMALTVSSPKLGFKAEQGLKITPEGPKGTKDFNWVTPSDKDNNWGMELSLNGSAQAGTHFPFNIETNTWAKKIFWCSTGIDAYVGPKLSAKFALDPVELAKGDAYKTFANTKINFKPLAAVLEGTAKFSTGTKYEEEFKIFDAELGGNGVDLTLFPKFDQTEIKYYDLYTEASPGYYNLLEVNVFPRGNSVPFYVGAAIYSEPLPSTGKQELVRANYKDFEDRPYRVNGGEERMYSFFNPYDQSRYFFFDLIDGVYTIVPIIKVLGYDVPVWDSFQEIEVFEAIRASSPEGHKSSDLWKPYEINIGESIGTIEISRLCEGDKVEFEFIEGNSFTSNSDKGVTKIGSRVTFTEIAREEIVSNGGQKLYNVTYRFDSELSGYDNGGVSHWESNLFKINCSRNIKGKKHERKCDYTLWFYKSAN